jgi:hypothetical protein
VGTLDLLTVSGVDCEVEGINLKHSVSATANAAHLKATAAAHRLAVRRCACDDTAITATWTGNGIELTAGADDQVVDECVFLDTQFGVNLVASSTNESDRTVVKNSTFFVGQAMSFGILALSATGKVQGLRVLGCHFIEADGDGSAATDAWDGSTGSDATVGPIKIGAAVDQFLISDCRASTALAATFENLMYTTSGAAGEIIDCLTATSGSVSNVYSDTTILVSDSIIIESNTIVIESQTTVLESDSIIVESSIQVVESETTVLQSDSIIIESSVQVAESNTAVIESDTIVIESSVQIVESDTAVIESDCADILSDTTIIESDSIIIESSIQVIESETTVLQSDSIIVESSVQVIESETTVLQSDSIIIESSVQVAESDAVELCNWDVRTVKKSALALDGGSVADVFAVAGGPVELIGLVMHLTEAVSAHACACHWESDPTIGAANTDLCATVDINAFAIGDHIYIDGTSGNAAVHAANGTAVGQMCDKSMIVFPGGIDFDAANNTPTSGIADAYLTYRPLAVDAVVTAP